MRTHTKDGHMPAGVNRCTCAKGDALVRLDYGAPVDERVDLGDVHGSSRIRDSERCDCASATAVRRVPVQRGTSGDVGAGGRCVDVLGDVPAGYGRLRHDRSRVGHSNVGADVAGSEVDGGAGDAGNGGCEDGDGNDTAVRLSQVDDAEEVRDAHALVGRVGHDVDLVGGGHCSLELGGGDGVVEADCAGDADIPVNVWLLDHHQLLAVRGVHRVGGCLEIDVKQPEPLEVLLECLDDIGRMEGVCFKNVSRRIELSYKSVELTVLALSVLRPEGMLYFLGEADAIPSCARAEEPSEKIEVHRQSGHAVYRELFCTHEGELVQRHGGVGVGEEESEEGGRPRRDE